MLLTAIIFQKKKNRGWGPSLTGSPQNQGMTCNDDRNKTFLKVKVCYSFRHVDTVGDIELIKESTYRTSSE